MPKSNAEKQDDSRARKKAGIFKRRCCYAHPDDWPKLRELEAEMRKKRLLMMI